MQTCKTLFLRLVCAQFMGNLRSATLEIWALLSMRRAGPLASFVTPSISVAPHLCPRILHILFHLVQILGKTVRPDKGPDCKRTSVDRHNSHAGCPVLPLLPYDSPVRHSEVKPTNVLSLRSKFQGIGEPKELATTSRTQTGGWR